MPNKSLVYLGFVLMALSACTKGGPSYSRVGYNPIISGTTGQLSGDVSYGEIILTSVALTAAEESRVEGYLASKWGSTALLPIGHTYKSSAP